MTISPFNWSYVNWNQLTTPDAIIPMTYFYLHRLVPQIKFRSILSREVHGSSIVTWLLPSLLQSIFCLWVSCRQCPAWLVADVCACNRLEKERRPRWRPSTVLLLWVGRRPCGMLRSPSFPLLRVEDRWWIFWKLLIPKIKINFFTEDVLDIIN